MGNDCIQGSFESDRSFSIDLSGKSSSLPKITMEVRAIEDVYHRIVPKDTGLVQLRVFDTKSQTEHHIYVTPVHLKDLLARVGYAPEDLNSSSVIKQTLLSISPTMKRKESHKSSPPLPPPSRPDSELEGQPGSPGFTTLIHSPSSSRSSGSEGILRPTPPPSRSPTPPPPRVEELSEEVDFEGDQKPLSQFDIIMGEEPQCSISIPSIPLTYFDYATSMNPIAVTAFTSSWETLMDSRNPMSLNFQGSLKSVSRELFKAHEENEVALQGGQVVITKQFNNWDEEVSSIQRLMSRGNSLDGNLRQKITPQENLKQLLFLIIYKGPDVIRDYYEKRDMNISEPEKVKRLTILLDTVFESRFDQILPFLSVIGNEQGASSFVRERVLRICEEFLPLIQEDQIQLPVSISPNQNWVLSYVQARLNGEEPDIPSYSLHEEEIQPQPFEEENADPLGGSLPMPPLQEPDILPDLPPLGQTL